MSGLEDRLAEVWAGVLGLDRVAPLDDFFELGGNSLHAVQIVSRAEELAGVHLSVRSVLETRTVRGMAGYVEQAMAAAS